MATREERIRVAIVGATEGARDLDRLGKATDRLGGEFTELGRDAAKLDTKLDELRGTQRELAAEFARTGDAAVGQKLKAATAEIATAVTARKALVGDIEDALDEADRAAQRRAKDDQRRRSEAVKSAQRAAKQLAAAAKAAADEHDRQMSRITDRLKSAAGAGLGGARVVGGAGAAAAGLASLAGPAVSGMVAFGKAAVVAGKAVAGLAPLAATLPALAAGFALVVGTAKMAGPAIGKELSPIAEAFTGIQDKIGQIASKGLRDLSKEFVRVNFPAISKAMQDIAGDMNTVLRVVGKWINSASGQQMIRDITEATAAATDKLDGRVARLAISFGELVKRVGPRAITGAADALAKLAESTIKWLDSIDGSDIDGAMKSLGGWGQKAKDVFNVLKDVGSWMADNEGKVKAFSNVIAGLAIVVGAATGNVFAVLAGGASLAINNWDGLKKSVGGTGDAFKKIAQDQHVKGIFQSIREGWKGFVDSFREVIDNGGLREKWKGLVDSLKEAWDEWGPIIKAWWDGVGKPVLSALGALAGGVLLALVDYFRNVADTMTIVGKGFKMMWDIASAVFGAILGAAQIAFGWLPGIGPKLDKAVKDFESFRDRVNGALDGIDDEEINVTVRYREKGRALGISNDFQSGIGGRAHGGPVQAGRPYIVGEDGPELITPNRSGHVWTAAQTASMLSGGGGQTVHRLIVEDTSGRVLLDKILNAGLGTQLMKMRRSGDLPSLA